MSRFGTATERMAFASELQAEIQRTGITLARLGEVAGVPRHTAARWSRGERGSTPEQRDRVMDALRRLPDAPVVRGPMTTTPAERAERLTAVLEAADLVGIVGGEIVRGLTVRQIADTLGMPVPTVRLWLYKAQGDVVREAGREAQPSGQRRAVVWTLA